MLHSASFLNSSAPGAIRLAVVAVSGWYFAHPQSKYFGVGRVAQDQVADIAARKGMEQATMERWLGSNLAYEP